MWLLATGFILRARVTWRTVIREPVVPTWWPLGESAWTRWPDAQPALNVAAALLLASFAGRLITDDAMSQAILSGLPGILVLPVVLVHVLILAIGHPRYLMPTFRGKVVDIKGTQKPKLSAVTTWYLKIAALIVGGSAFGFWRTAIGDKRGIFILFGVLLMIVGVLINLFAAHRKRH